MSDGKMPNSRFDGLWARATNNAGDPADARALAEEALRARSAETEQAEQLRQKDERITKLAVFMGVPDGGRYINDWESKAEVVRQKDETIRALADALETQFEKPEAEHLRGCPHSFERYRHVAQPCSEECMQARIALRLAGRFT